MQSQDGAIQTTDTMREDAGLDSHQNASEVRLYIAPYNPFVVPINGFIFPTLIAITLVTNCVVCAVLLRPHMRSPTNIVLVAIATSDMLTGQYFIYLYK